MSGFLFDAIGPYIISAAGDDRDYSVDWTNLLNVGETISTSTWTVPTGLVAGLALIVVNVTTQWITSPTVGSYIVVSEITTSQGRIYNRSFRLIVNENI